MSELRKLETMTPDEFGKMMEDIGKGHRVEKYDKITRAAVHVDPPKIYGFLGWVNGEIKCEWEFETLLKSPKVCDWLDYYGFDRPKWRPASSELESVGDDQPQNRNPQEKAAEKLLARLRAEPLAKEREEFGRMLMRHIDSYTPEERKRYDELKAILREGW